MPIVEIYGEDIEFPDSMSEDELQKAVQAAAAQLKPAPKSVSKAPTPQPVRDPLAAAGQGAMRGLRDLGAGAIRGAGSIGATLVAPGDYLADWMLGSGDVSRNEARRKGMDEGLQSLTGADPSSIGYGVGKIGTEIAGTLGINPASAAALLKVAPKSVPLAQSINTGGMQVGGMTGFGGAATRAAGGAIGGAASAGLVDPEYAATGAMIGGIAPSAVRAAGATGRAIGGVVSGPQQSPEAIEAVRQARAAGYVIPPTQAKPTLFNRAIEGYAGKLTTEQNASATNQFVTNRMAAKALGLPEDVEITPEALSVIRKQAGRAYDEISNAGTVVPGKAYEDALEKIAAPFRKASAGFPSAKPNAVIADIESLKTTEFDAGAGIAKVSELRELADEAYRAGRKKVGGAYKDAALAIEDSIERHLIDTQAPAEMLSAFRNARQTIAKTYTVEKALNPSTGTIDAKKLGADLKKGKPLSGELKDIASFANKYQKAVQVPERMGSLPQISPLDFASVGAISAATQKPGVIGAIVGRPIARSIALSPMVQNRLAAPQSASLLDMFSDPQIAEYASRAAPVMLSR